MLYCIDIQELQAQPSPPPPAGGFFLVHGVIACKRNMTYAMGDLRVLNCTAPPCILFGGKTAWNQCGLYFAVISGSRRYNYCCSVRVARPNGLQPIRMDLNNRNKRSPPNPFVRSDCYRLGQIGVHNRIKRIGFHRPSSVVRLDCNERIGSHHPEFGCPIAALCTTGNKRSGFQPRVRFSDCIRFWAGGGGIMHNGIKQIGFQPEFGFPVRVGHAQPQ